MAAAQEGGSSPAAGLRRVLVEQAHAAAFTLDLRAARQPPPCLPPATKDSGQALPCVVLADGTGLQEFNVLQRDLIRLGVPSVRLDPRSVGDLHIVAGLHNGSVAVNGHRIVPVVSWLRHFSARGIPSVRDPATTMLRADSWNAIVQELSASASIRLPGATPGHLQQLRDAAAAGIRTPRTIVTTDPGTVSAHLRSDRIILKALHHHFVEIEPGLLVGVFPEIVERDEIGRLASLDFPVVAQEYVPHDRELRIFYLRGDIHAFEVVKGSADALWRDSSAVSVTSTAAPHDATGVVRRLAASWSLTYGAFDVLLTGKDTVFLEANPDGDWRWFESKAGVACVSVSATAMVRTLYREALRGVRDPPAVELVDFLLMSR